MDTLRRWIQTDMDSRDLVEWLYQQRKWSLQTFGEGRRTEGIIKHIEKELEEVRQEPGSLMEWIDVVILALDGAWRAGYSPEEVAWMLGDKQRVNFSRRYPFPDSQDEPSEHERGKE